MKKLVMLIVILCSLCNADYMDTANRNLCAVKTYENRVAIGCDYRDNDEDVKRSIIVIHTDAKECEEHIYFRNGYVNRSLLFVHEKTGIISLFKYDEYGVELEASASKAKIKDVKELCMTRYEKYKKAKNRW